MRRLLRRWADKKLRRWADPSLRSRNLALESQSAMRSRIARNLAAKLAEERQAFRRELEEANDRADRAEALLREARDADA